MTASVPGHVTWDGVWCANHPADVGYVESEADGRVAVERLGDELGQVLAGRDARDPAPPAFRPNAPLLNGSTLRA